VSRSLVHFVRKRFPAKSPLDTGLSYVAATSSAVGVLGVEGRGRFAGRLGRGAGGTRTRDQRINDPWVWVVPVNSYLLLCHKVTGRATTPARTGQFRSIPGHWRRISDD
jgi:hypothetical protein